jgi:hypothetical protein
VGVVVVAEFVGGHEIRIGGPEIGFQAAEPAWSPDGRALAIMTSNLPGREAQADSTALWVYGPDGSKIAQLLAASNLARPDWGAAP